MRGQREASLPLRDVNLAEVCHILPAVIEEDPPERSTAKHARSHLEVALVRHALIDIVCCNGCLRPTLRDRREPSRLAIVPSVRNRVAVSRVPHRCEGNAVVAEYEGIIAAPAVVTEWSRGIQSLRTTLTT